MKSNDPGRPLSPSRNREIDLLRFVAALTVLLYHYTYAFPAMDPSYPYHFSIGRQFRYGYLAVDLFFIISGYVIMLSAHNKTAKQFIRSRVFRLYPAYWISCIVTFLIMVIGPSLSSKAPHVTVTQLLYNLTMFQEFFGRTSLNSVYWTLTYELSFYILIILVISFKAWDYILYILAGWLVYTFLAGPLAINTYLSAVLIPKYSAYFMAGILFYLLRNKLFPAWQLYGLLGLSFIAALRSASQLHHVFETMYADYFNFLVIAAAISSFFIIFWWIAVFRPDFSSWTFFSRLGALTYPLYLLQIPGATFFYCAAGRVNNYLMLILTTFCMLLCAWLVNKFLAMRWMEWINFRRPKVAAS